jgi:hypothetical protein
MKIGGITVSRNEQVLVLPRIDDDIVIKAAALLSYDEMNDLMARPSVPNKRTKDGLVPHTDHPDYKSMLETYASRRWAYICIKSLEPSEIEWSRVDIGKPETWTEWTKELQEAGLSDTEVGRISTLVLEVNSLNDAKLEEARKLFLRGKETPEA